LVQFSILSAGFRSPYPATPGQFIIDFHGRIRENRNVCFIGITYGKDVQAADQDRKKKGKSYLIGDKVVLIGRDSSSTITLPDKKVSRRHASISPRGAEFLIEDLGSVNGTMVNNRPVRRQTLKPGMKSE